MTRFAIPLVPRWLRWAGVLAVGAAVFYLSVITAPPEHAVAPEPDLVPLDKWRHFLAYAALAGSLAYATVDWEWPTTHLAALVLGVTVVYGAGIEGIQATIPRRYFSPADAYANALGAVLVTPWFAIRSRLPFVRLPGGERWSLAVRDGESEE